jgi:hypothetical protein
MKVKCPECGISVTMPDGWDGKDEKESLCNRCHAIEEALTGRKLVTFENGKTWPVENGRVTAIVEILVSTVLFGDREDFLDILSESVVGGGVGLSDICYDLVEVPERNVCRFQVTADVEDVIRDSWAELLVADAPAEPAIMNRLSEKEKALYVEKKGLACPHCGSERLSAGTKDADGEIITVDVSCDKCRADWQDVYTLTGIVEVNEPLESNTTAEPAKSTVLSEDGAHA